MSRRRTARSRQVVSSDEEDAAPPPPRAARRAALQLSQSQHASGGGSSAGSALAMLLAGAKQPAAPGGGPACGDSQPAAPAAAAGGSPVSRRRGRATLPKPKLPAAVALAAAAAAEAGGSQQQGAAPSAPPAAPGDLWVEKHAPSCEAELVVHKKKVQEVREWLEQQRASLGQRGVSRLLVVSGVAGAGGGWLLAGPAARCDAAQPAATLGVPGSTNLRSQQHAALMPGVPPLLLAPTPGRPLWLRQVGHPHHPGSGGGV